MVVGSRHMVIHRFRVRPFDKVEHSQTHLVGGGETTNVNNKKPKRTRNTSSGNELTKSLQLTQAYFISRDNNESSHP